MSYFLGIDVSTTGSKALLIDEKGGMIGTAVTPHTLSTPRPQWSEQDPAEWWNATCNSIHKVLESYNIKPDAIKAIGLTGQMHGLVLLDANGKVQRPAILWNDQRTQVQCDQIHQRIGEKRFIQISGNRALTGFTAPKVLWVAQNEPEVFALARHVLLPKDYIRYRLTGQFAMDKADGSGTVLFDLKLRNWSAEVLEQLGIPQSWMPPTFEGPEFTGEINETAAKETGLAIHTPVCAGGGDQEAGAVGVGAVEPGIIGLTVGTSGVVFTSTTAPLVEPEGRLHAFCHAVPGMWHFMGVMLSAAGSLQWFHDSLAPELSFDGLLKEAEKVPAGSEGLYFLPYLSGERTPHPDPDARGAFIGLTLRHHRGHMTRAILEGVGYGLKDGFKLIQDAGVGAVKQIRASGGGTKGALWRQILASILGNDLVTINTTEGAAFGAALLAGVGAGAWPDVQSACRETIKVTAQTPPDTEMANVYAKSYSLFTSLYLTLKDRFKKIAEI